MSEVFGPTLAGLVLVCVATLFGVWPVRKLVEIKEAKHELKHGSPGFLRSLAGWIVIAIWLLGTWFLATITGDWWITGDLEGALARSGRRLEVILHLLAALASE